MSHIDPDSLYKDQGSPYATEPVIDEDTPNCEGCGTAYLEDWNAEDLVAIETKDADYGEWCPECIEKRLKGKVCK